MLKTITDFSELQALLRKHKGEVRTHTNFYMMPDECKRLITDGRLMYADFPQALLLFERRDGYSKLYLRSAGDAAALELPSEPLVSFVTYRDEPDAGVAGRLTAMGFRKELTQLRLSAPSVSASTRADAAVTSATEDEAVTLFSQCFTELRGDLPCRGSFQSLAAVRGDDGVPLGIIHYDDAKTVLLIAVRAEARRRGIAETLLAHYAAVTTHMRGDCKLWVLEDNANALRLYEKIGFVADGLKSDMYVYNQGKD